MNRSLVLFLAAVILSTSAFGIVWSAKNNFGMLQAVEFHPYKGEFKLQDGSSVQSSGVVIRINTEGTFASDREIANLMVSCKRMYPVECSGNNWEICVIRPAKDAIEEQFRYYYTTYELGGPCSWLEYGIRTNKGYSVIESRKTIWEEIIKVSQGTINEMWQ